MPTYYGVKFPDLPASKASAKRPTHTPGAGAGPDVILAQQAAARAADPRLSDMARVAAQVYGEQLGMLQGRPAAPAARAVAPAAPAVYLPLPTRAAEPAPLGVGASPDVILAQQARRYEAAGLRPPPDIAPVQTSAVPGLEEIGRRAVGTAQTDIFGLPLPRPAQPPPMGAGPDVRLAQMERSSLVVPQRAPGIAPETWEENARIAEGLQRIAQAAAPVVQPLVSGALTLAERLDQPYRQLTEPFYVGIMHGSDRAQVAELERLSRALASGEVSADRVPAYQARIAELERQLREEQRRLLNPAYALQQMRATPEEVRRYRETAPWWEQLAAAAVLDPLNLVSMGGARALEAVRVVRAQRALRPVALTVDEAADLLRREGMVGRGAGRFLPWRLTNTAQKEALVNESVNWLNLVTRDLAGNPFDNLEAFIRDPDALARATDGLTSSLPAKQTAALMREVLRDPESGQVTYQTLRKIFDKAKGDRLQVVADVARRFDEAAQSFFPAQPRSLPYRLRDWLYGWLSVGQLGLNPGYAVRNAATNMAISLLDGFVPLTSSRTINRFWQRWGPMPVQAKAGITGAADVWKARRRAMDYIESLERTEGVRGLVEGIGEDKLRPMATFSGNIERAFSEQITYQGTLRAWRPLWEQEVAQFRRQLEGIGLPSDVVEALVGDAYQALNPQELREAARRLLAPLSPAGAPPAPAGALPPGATVSAVVQQAQIPGFPVVIPAAVQQHVIDVLGEDGGRRVLEAIKLAGSNEARAAVLDTIDDVIGLVGKTAQQAAQIDTLGQIDPAKLVGNREAILQWLRREGEILAEARAAHDAALERVWERSRLLTPDERMAAWEVFWDQFVRDVRVVHEGIDDLESALMPRLGFTSEAVTRARVRREQIEQAWEAYAQRLRETWEQSARLDQAARDALWRDFKAWARQHWEADQQRALAYVVQRDVDIAEALAQRAAAPAPPTAPTGVVPAAPAGVVPAAPAGAAVPPTNSELRRLASQVGIATITEKGRPYDRHLISAINRDLQINIKRLSELTPEQRAAAAEALRQRAAAVSAAPPPAGAVTPPTGAVPGIVWHPMSLSAIWNAFTEPANRAIAALRRAVTVPPGSAVAPPAPLSQEAAQRLNDAINQLAARMVRAKATASRVGVSWRNAVLGDYSRRRNLHDWMGWLYLYPSWYMFTYPNMALRLALKPAFLSNYARYRAAVQRENERYWQETTGAATASALPPRYTQMLRIHTPWGVRFFQIERLLNPMANLVDVDFTTRELEQLPQWMQTLRGLGNLGPSLSSPILWTMALSIARTNPVAARQLVGYQLSFTRPIKDFTAYIRSKLPVLEEVIPPGGIVIEAPINPAVRPQIPQGEQVSPFYGGDYWSERRTAIFLEAMVANGEITEEQAAEAAAKRWGPIWDRARQAEALANAPTTLLSFLGGPAMRGRDLQQMRIEAMDAEWFDLRQRVQAMTPEQRRQAYDEFFQRWQTYDVLRLARVYDPLERLADYAWMVIDRVPYGYQRRRVFEEAGIADLIDKFYASDGRFSREPAASPVAGGPLEGGVYPPASVVWTDEEIERLAAGIDAIAKRFRIPSPAQEVEWERARKLHEDKRMRALAMLQGEQGQFFTMDAIRRLEAAYFSLPQEMRQDFLDRNPTLRRWWDLLDEAEAAMTPEELQAERALYESPESARNRIIWEESLPPGGNWRRALPAGTIVPDYVEALYDEQRRAAMSDEEVQRAVTWLQNNVPERFMRTEEWRQAREDNQLLEELQRQEFGDDFIDWYKNVYQPMSTEQKRAFRRANPKIAQRIYELYDFNDAFGEDHPIWQKYYGFSGAGGEGGRSGGRGRRRYRSYRRRRGGYGGGYGAGLPVATPVAAPTTPGAPSLPSFDQYNALLAELRADPAFDALARLLFGSDIFDLLARWYALTPEQQAALMQQDQAAYARILRFLSWLASGAGRQASRVLPSIPGGNVNQMLPTMPVGMG